MDTIKELLDAMTKKNWLLVAVLAMEIAAKLLRGRLADAVLASAPPPLDDLGSLSMDDLTNRLSTAVTCQPPMASSGDASYISPIWLPLVLAILRKVLQNF